MFTFRSPFCAAAFASLWLGACSSESIDTQTAVSDVCTTAGIISDSLTNAGPSGTVVHYTATSGCAGGDVAEYQFYELAPGGSWTLARDFSTSPSYTFNTTGLPAGQYDFQVWVRAQGDGVPYESAAYISFTVTGAGSPCTSATLSLPITLGLPGTPVPLTGSAAGCPTPQYAFYELAPGGSWTLVQDYSASSIYLFTDPGTTGDYNFQVWVRDATSVGAYDAYAGAVYTDGFALANQSSAALADGTVVATNFSGKVCQNGLSAGPLGNYIAVCTTDNGVWFGQVVSGAPTVSQLHNPLWAQNNGQIASDPASTNTTGTFPSLHGNGISSFSGGGGQVAFFTSDTGVGNWGRSNSFATLDGPYAYPSTAVVWRSDTSPSGTVAFPRPITAALIGTSTTNYLGSSDTMSNAVVLTGNTTATGTTSNAIGTGVTGKVTSFTPAGSVHDYHLAVNGAGGGGMYWICQSSNAPPTISSFVHDDTGISASDKALVFTVVTDGSTFSNNQTTKRTCGSITNIGDYTLVMYAGLLGGGSLYKTTDGGNSWSLSNTGLPTNASVYTIVLDRPTSSLWAATSSGIYHSSDSGANWSLVGLSGKNVLGLAVIPAVSSSTAAVNFTLATATASGTTATFTTTTPTNIAVTSQVRILGASVAGYNGLWTVSSVLSSTQFTATVGTSGLGASTGGTASISYERIVAATDEQNGIYQSVAPPGTASYTGTNAVACTTGGALTVSPASPIQAGAGNVAFTVAGQGAGGCQSPQYTFYMLPPGGAWSVVQGPSPRATYTLLNGATSPALAGNYSMQIWVKDASSTSAYDMFKASSYTINPSGVPCTAATLSPSVPSPQTVGTPLTLTAGSSTCANPQYSFYELAPGGSWTLMQGPSSTNTYNVNTSGPSGGYNFQVWVKDASSTGAYDVFNALSYTLSP
jgi:hypothetical protein